MLQFLIPLIMSALSPQTGVKTKNPMTGGVTQTGSPWQQAGGWGGLLSSMFNSPTKRKTPAGFNFGDSSQQQDFFHQVILPLLIRGMR